MAAGNRWVRAFLSGLLAQVLVLGTIAGAIIMIRNRTGPTFEGMQMAHSAASWIEVILAPIVVFLIAWWVTRGLASNHLAHALIVALVAVAGQLSIFIETVREGHAPAWIVVLAVVLKIGAGVAAAKYTQRSSGGSASPTPSTQPSGASRPMGRSFLLAGVVLLASCGRPAPPSSSSPVDTVMVGSELRTRRNLLVVSERVTASADSIWKVVPAAFKELGYQGHPSATEPLTYVTPPLRIEGRLYTGELNSSYIDCGRTPAGGLAADEYSITFAVFVRIERIVADASTIEARIDGVARARSESSGRIRCWGKGKLEDQFLRAIKRRLGVR